MKLDLENYGFFIVVEFVDRKIGFAKLVFVTRAEADKITDEYFEQFEPYSLGSSLSFPEDLCQPFIQYNCKYHDYLEFGPQQSKILRERSSSSNGDLTVSVVERIEKISISKFIKCRNLPFFHGFSLQ